MKRKVDRQVRRDYFAVIAKAVELREWLHGNRSIYAINTAVKNHEYRIIIYTSKEHELDFMLKRLIIKQAERHQIEFIPFEIHK